MWHKRRPLLPRRHRHLLTTKKPPQKILEEMNIEPNQIAETVLWEFYGNHAAANSLDRSQGSKEAESGG